MGLQRWGLLDERTIRISRREFEHYPARPSRLFVHDLSRHFPLVENPRSIHAALAVAAVVFAMGLYAFSKFDDSSTHGFQGQATSARHE